MNQKKLSGESKKPHSEEGPTVEKSPYTTAQTLYLIKRALRRFQESYIQSRGACGGKKVCLLRQKGSRLCQNSSKANQKSPKINQRGPAVEKKSVYITWQGPYIISKELESEVKEPYTLQSMRACGGKKVCILHHKSPILYQPSPRVLCQENAPFKGASRINGCEL